MHRTLVCDLSQACALFIAQRAVEANGAFDPVHISVSLGLAFDAILRVYALLAQAHRDALTRPLFAPRVERDGHRDATAERREQQRVRIGAGIRAARA